MRGFVEFVDAGRGYLFIWDLEKRIKYFAHATNVESDGGIKLLHVGNLVDFEPGMTARGPIALNVRSLNREETIEVILSTGSAK